MSNCAPENYESDRRKRHVKILATQVPSKSAGTNEARSIPSPSDRVTKAGMKKKKKTPSSDCQSARLSRDRLAAFLSRPVRESRRRYFPSCATEWLRMRTEFSRASWKASTEFTDVWSPTTTKQPSLNRPHDGAKVRLGCGDPERGYPPRDRMGSEEAKMAGRGSASLPSHESRLRGTRLIRPDEQAGREIAREEERLAALSLDVPIRQLSISPH